VEVCPPAPCVRCADVSARQRFAPRNCSSPLLSAQPLVLATPLRAPRPAGRHTFAPGSTSCTSTRSHRRTRARRRDPAATAGSPRLHLLHIHKDRSPHLLLQPCSCWTGGFSPLTRVPATEAGARGRSRRDAARWRRLGWGSARWRRWVSAGSIHRSARSSGLIGGWDREDLRRGGGRPGCGGLGREDGGEVQRSICATAAVDRVIPAASRAVQHCRCLASQSSHSSFAIIGRRTERRSQSSALPVACRPSERRRHEGP